MKTNGKDVFVPFYSAENENGAMYWEAEESEAAFDERDERYGFFIEKYACLQEDQNGLLFAISKSGDHCALVSTAACKEKQIVVPAKFGGKAVTQIAPDAFNGSEVECAVLPRGLERVGAFAFAYCTKLEKMEIQSVKTVFEDSAFFNCHRLKCVICKGIPQTSPRFECMAGHSSPLSYGAEFILNTQEGEQADE